MNVSVSADFDCAARAGIGAAWTAWVGCGRGSGKIPGVLRVTTLVIPPGAV